MSFITAPLFPGLATICGYQEPFEDIPGFWLYNLLRDIPGHPRFSTVSEQTLAAI